MIWKWTDVPPPDRTYIPPPNLSPEQIYDEVAALAVQGNWIIDLLGQTIRGAGLIASGRIVLCNGSFEYTAIPAVQYGYATVFADIHFREAPGFKPPQETIGFSAYPCANAIVCALFRDEGYYWVRWANDPVYSETESVKEFIAYWQTNDPGHWLLVGDEVKYEDMQLVQASALLSVNTKEAP